MERKDVESSDIKSIGFDEESHILEIEFHKTGIYRYLGVYKALYDTLMLATTSKGHFLAKAVKPFFPCIKVKED